MAANTFMSVDEVASELGISKSYAYKIVQRLNNELKEKGFITISGRLNKQYFILFVIHIIENINRNSILLFGSTYWHT